MYHLTFNVKEAANHDPIYLYLPAIYLNQLQYLIVDNLNK